MSKIINLLMLIIFCGSCMNQREVESYNEPDANRGDKCGEIDLVADRQKVNPGEGVRLRCNFENMSCGLTMEWYSSGGLLFGSGENVVWIAPDEVGEYNIKCAGKVGSVVELEGSVRIKVEETKENNGKIDWEKKYGKRYQSEIIEKLSKSRYGGIIFGGKINDTYTSFFAKYDNNGKEIFSIYRSKSKYSSNFFNFATDVYDNIYFVYTLQPVIKGDSEKYITVIEKFNLAGKMEWSKIFSTFDENYIYPVYFDTIYEGFIMCYKRGLVPDNANLFIDKYDGDGNKQWGVNLNRIIKEVKDIKVYMDGILVWGYNDVDRLVIINSKGNIEGLKDIEDGLLSIDVSINGDIYTIEKYTKNPEGLYLVKYSTDMSLISKKLLIKDLSIFSIDCKPRAVIRVDGRAIFIGANVYSGERVCDYYTPPGPAYNCSCGYYTIIVKYDIDVEELWRREGGKGSIDIILDLWGDGFGSAYTKRYYPKYKKKNPYEWEDKYFLIKYNSKGDEIWSLMFPDEIEYPFVIKDFQNNIYVVSNINEGEGSSYRDIVIMKIE